MKSIQRGIIYFQAPGKQNTESVLQAVKSCAQTQEIRDIVVASTTGRTGLKASEILKDLNLVVVSHHVGFREPGAWELREENRRKIIRTGAKILAATHTLSGVERAVRKKFDTILPLELIAHTLRLFGEGTKVCVEITLMAADAGLIPVDKEVIAIA
ncbi:hypothetical protein GWN63_02685, partial [Candidatus Bathyarchaeota archaeon]|nr:hypothetical protein [Candidatus Bathyarchaeota archaeon]NIV67769.1 hypothetical protein [Candidatus Bathyarchaeota archaeon]NIW16402.1 hypothetical protein [Candidatus Bathyarchaeota archaeon]NIW34375.1 hypothetical protein [Candidatus Bathyarchaeota archaeon]